VAFSVLASAMLVACNPEIDMRHDDRAMAWDNVSASTDSQVDWPVTLIFYGPGAEVNSVKNMLHTTGLSSDSGGSMYMKLKDAPGSSKWDSDRGKKSPGLTVCQAPFGPHTGRHIRVYADPGDDIMNSTYWLGGFVVGTTHWDINEGCEDRDKYGDSEEVESWLASKLSGSLYYNNDVRVARNQFWMNNEANYDSGQRIMRSNGMATLIYMGSSW
jgi:hypothetical protein